MVAAAVRHPISRWYLLPLARAAAAALASLPFARFSIRPTHITLAGLCFALLAVALLLWLPTEAPAAAFFVLAAWFCDRVDGMFARMTGKTTVWGGWLDANVDEFTDVALQAAVAAAAAALTASQLPWMLLFAFLAGKYLFMFGLPCEESIDATKPTASNGRNDAVVTGRLRCLYHLPGDADIRVHLLIIALITGWLTAELALLAAYYNLRWIARYPLNARRLGGSS